MFVWWTEVKEQLGNLRGLASDKRKEVRGTVMSLLEFFLSGEVEMVFVAPRVFCLFVVCLWMKSACPSGEWDRSWPMQTKEGTSALSWGFGHTALHLLCSLRSKQTFFLES